MRLLFLVALGTALVVASPQNEERARLRGLRRFALATPGLQAGKPLEAAVENEAVEESVVVPEVSEPRIRNRGTSLLRRGHPSLRTRGRVSSQNEETAVAVEEPVEDPSAADSNQKRAGLRIRRPLKKVTITTASPATTTMIPEVTTESIVAESTVLTSTTYAPFFTEVTEVETMMLKPEEEVLFEEPTPMMKDEFMQKTMSKLESELISEKSIPVEEDPSISLDIPNPEAKSQDLPRPKKLRPIPIKLGRRNKGEAEQQDVPADVAVIEDQEPVTSVNKPVSSHRFSSRPRPRLQSKRRGEESSIKQQEETPVEVPQPDVPAAEESPSPKIQRTRARVPHLRRPSTRTPSRLRPTEAEAEPEEAPAATPAVEDIITEVQEPETRFPDLNELKTILTQPTESEGVPLELEDEPPRITASRTPELSEPERFEPPVVETRTEIKSVPASQSQRSHSTRIRRPENTEKIIEEILEPKATDASKFPTPNYGGSDLIFKGGEVHPTQIGVIEDTPRKEIQRILSGLGSMKRGLGRPKESSRTRAETKKEVLIDSVASPSKQKESVLSDIDYLYEYYDYPTNETITK